MSQGVFSVMVGRADQVVELDAYVQRFQRVEKGVKDLLKPICKNSKIRLFKRIDNEKNEWLDVKFEEGAQGDIFADLEQSSGSSFTITDVEREHAQARARKAVYLRNELNTKRTWRLTEFFDLVDRQDLATAGRNMGNDLGTLVILSTDGRLSSALMPNRKFSALRDQSLSLQIRPVSVGDDRATVRLSKASRVHTAGKSRQLKMVWDSVADRDFSDELYAAVRQQRWISARCRVIENREGLAKSLVLESIAT